MYNGQGVVVGGGGGDETIALPFCSIPPPFWKGGGVMCQIYGYERLGQHGSILVCYMELTKYNVTRFACTMKRHKLPPF